MFLLILTVFLLSVFLKLVVYRKSEYPPEISGKLPLLGHALRFYGDSLKAVETVKDISKECKENGGIATLYMGKTLFYVIVNPEDCLKVSNLCLNKTQLYDIARPFLGNGLTIAHAELWKKKRKILNSALNNNILNEFMFIFNEKSRKLVEIFEDKIVGGAFDHYDILKRIFLESICLTSYGVNVEKYKENYENYLQGTGEILEIFYERFSKFWLHYDFIYNKTKLKKRQDRMMKSINLFNGIMLKERKLIMRKRKKSLPEAMHGPEFKPFMDIIIENYADLDGLTDEDVMFETNNLVGAGFDTSATVVTFILTLLGSHQRVQNKVRHEINQVFGKNDRDVVKDDLPKLAYMEAVLKETTRLYPLAALVARDVEKTVHLKNCTLKAGTSCLLLYWGLHRHEVWGPDAESFRPERWLESDLPNIHSSYAGFSLGKRSCVGKSYAIMNIKVALVHLLRNYKIYSDVSKMELKLDVLLRPHSGHEISIEKIE